MCFRAPFIRAVIRSSGRLQEFVDAFPRAEALVLPSPYFISLGEKLISIDIDLSLSQIRTIVFPPLSSKYALTERTQKITTGVGNHLSPLKYRAKSPVTLTNLKALCLYGFVCSGGFSFHFIPCPSEEVNFLNVWCVCGSDLTGLDFFLSKCSIKTLGLGKVSRQFSRDFRPESMTAKMIENENKSHRHLLRVIFENQHLRHLSIEWRVLGLMPNMKDVLPPTLESLSLRGLADTYTLDKYSPHDQWRAFRSEGRKLARLELVETDIALVQAVAGVAAVLGVLNPVGESSEIRRVLQSEPLADIVVADWSKLGIYQSRCKRVEWAEKEGVLPQPFKSQKWLQALAETEDEPLKYG
jgi:hypothetical protein